MNKTVKVHKIQLIFFLLQGMSYDHVACWLLLLGSPVSGYNACFRMNLTMASCLPYSLKCLTHMWNFFSPKQHEILILQLNLIFGVNELSYSNSTRRILEFDLRVNQVK